MKIAILSSFPPTKCGIASYADQQARYFEKQGHQVERFDIHRLNFSGWNSAEMMEFSYYARTADMVVLHYQPGLFYSQVGVPGVKSLVPYQAILRTLKEVSAPVTIVVHENYSPYLTPLVALQRSLVRKFFNRADRLVLHTTQEVQSFVHQYPSCSGKIFIVRPDEYFQKFTEVTKEEAREALGFRGPVKLVLSAGFYHPGKGFERLIRVFGDLTESGQIPEWCRLVVIASDREGTFGNEMARLLVMASDYPNRVRLVRSFVSDEEFDTWIAASDYVVVPYTYGFTSSLLSRAKIHGKTAIVSSLPALKEQAGPDDILFSSDDDLGTILKEVCA